MAEANSELPPFVPVSSRPRWWSGWWRVVGEPGAANISAKSPTPPPAWIFTTPERVAAKTIAAMRWNRGIVVVTPAARLLWWLKRLSPGAVDWVTREGWRSKGPVELEADGFVRDELGP